MSHLTTLLLLILFIFSMLGLSSLFHPGLFTAHDIWHQVARIYHYNQAISDGQFPPYWIGTLAQGYGYPLFFFSYHLPWIFAQPFLFLGIDIPTTLKILFFLAYFFSGLTMYLLAKHLFKSELSAILCGILYLWAPYHFLTILVSAAIGMVFVFAFIPILFLGIFKMSEDSKSVNGILLMALGLAGIILSHFMTLPFLLPFTAIFIFWLAIRQKNNYKIFLFKVLLGLTVGIIISSFYLIPAIYYNRFTKSSSEVGFSELYKRNFINFNQLIYSKWGYGPIVKNAKDGEISFQIGIAQWVSIASVLILFITTKSLRDKKGLMTVVLLGFGLGIFLMLDVSYLFWSNIARFVTIDYPTRSMIVVTFLGSLSAGLLLINVTKKLKYPLFITLVLIAIYTNRNHIKVNMYTNIPTSLYIDSEVTTNSYNEYLPLRTDPSLMDKPRVLIDPKEGVLVSNLNQNTNKLSFDINLSKEMAISLGQFAFPGQTLYVDGKRNNYEIDDRGRIKTNFSSGSHNVIIRFEETKVIKFSKLLSLLGFIVMGIIVLRRKLL